MANNLGHVWTLDGALKQISDIHHTMDDRFFAFVLEAGA